MPAELRIDVECPWPIRSPGGTSDGILRRRGPGVQRVFERDERFVHAGAAVLSETTVRFAARAETEADAAWAITRLRHALGVDDDLRPFYERFKDDPVIGRAVRAAPYFRVRRREPWEALLWAITEQLIEFERAVEIQRRMIRALGRRCPDTGLKVAPGPERIAGAAPALLASFDLNPQRTMTARRVAEEVARGRVCLEATDAAEQEAGWRRLRAINGIGPWTIENLALYGQGRYDLLPAGDLGYLKLVGRLLTGNPKVRVTDEEVRAFMAPYGEWAGLAGEYLRIGGSRGLLPLRVDEERRLLATRAATALVAA